MNSETQKSAKNQYREIFNFIFFVIVVAIGGITLNTFVFRSFNVSGNSMQTTLENGDRLIVNRLPVTQANLQNKSYTPKRGEIIIFKNPNLVAGRTQDYVVKRVIGLAGDRVVLKDSQFTIYNDKNPDGFDPDENLELGENTTPINGDFDGTVPEGSIFVVGDNRIGSNSCDSRGCLGYIPLYNVIGPVSLRIWPLHHLAVY